MSGPTLTPEAWRRVKEDFLYAIELDESELEAFLMDYPEELRPTLREMVDGHGLEGSYLDRPVQAPSRAEPPKPPDRIGPYRLERLIGHGGMGEVHLAFREADFQQRVAIKMLRGWYHGATLIRRFRAERRILARLEHPNIARLLDGGTTEDGRLYLAMEYVDGIPIDDYCDDHRLSISDRLRLFLKVASAVSLAHRNLVVHRDLKPANILVTQEGVPKLLDFGIAKLLDDAEAAEVGATATWQRPMTPEYASPEQLEGGPITTATDVYALGLLLIYLLTGVSARSLINSTSRSSPGGGPGIFRASAVVAGVDTPTVELERVQARGLDPRGLSRRLRGDLDILLAKAVHRDAQRRYVSVERLAKDVRRHLEGLPIRARPDTLSYRLRKFVRRQPLFAVSIFLMVIFAIGLSALAVQLDRQRDQLHLEQARSQAVAKVLSEIFEKFDPDEAKEPQVTGLDLLERGAEQARQPDEDSDCMGASGSGGDP